LIDRIYIKDHLSFKEIDLNFDKNLIIFTGASGAGKSILFDAILSLFGIKDSEAKSIEASIDKRLGLDKIGIEEDEPNIFKLTKQKSTRYFINNQQISKKNLQNFSKKFINYITLRDFDEFENENLLGLLDHIILQNDKNYQKVLDEFSSVYQDLKDKQNRLKKLQEDSKRLDDLKEFARFEIDKIESISPKIGEYEKLLEQKKELSKKEKIEKLIDEASAIFEYESQVTQALSIIEEDSTIFNEAMNDIRVKFENALQRVEELENIEIEELLDRIEKLSDLNRKYGSIQEALEYLDKKKIELEGYENITFEQDSIKNEIDKLSQKVDKLTNTISKKREESISILNKRANYYLNLLHLLDLNFSLQKKELDQLGKDMVDIHLANTPIDKVSSGELNRVRLAMLSAKSEFIQNEGGVLIVDEIDANLSGKESMSVAKVLEHLSKNYQIFAISHQPQLSSKAQMHFLVYKEDGQSRVKLLDNKEKIDELARMISGEKITKEAREFAISLLA